jgi:hypothetical protein
VVHYAKNPAAFANIFKHLGPHPVIRVGGFSTEALTGVPRAEVWAGLKALKGMGFKASGTAALVTMAGHLKCNIPAVMCH